MRKLAVLLLFVALVGCVSSIDTGSGNTTVVEDNVLKAPTVSPEGEVTASSVKISVKFEEPVVLTAFTIDGGTQNVTRVSEEEYEVSVDFDDGSHEVVVSAQDAAGNKASKTFTITVDSAAPIVIVDPENNEQTSLSDVEITATFSEEVPIVEAKINSNALSLTTTDNKLFTATRNLNDGEHSLYIKAKDSAGNEVVSDTTFTVSVASPDTTAPPQVGNVKATDTGKGGEVKLTWAAVSVADFKEYHVFKFTEEVTNVFNKDPAYFIKAKSTTSWTIGGLTDGTRYCFAVSAMDNAGNEDYDVLPSCVKPTESDKTEPSITDESPDGTVDDTNKPKIRVVTDEPASCRYSISDESDEEFDEMGDLKYTMDRSSNKTVHTRTHSALDNGTWYVYVMCEDLEDNAMATPHTWDFEIEYAPDTSNTAPSVSGVLVKPTSAYNTTDLTCDGDFDDDDGDSESGSEFRWWVNDVLVSGEDDDELDHTYFVKDDEVRCEYTPCDGDDCGDPKNSSKRDIKNSDPELSGDDVNASTGNVTEGTNVFRFVVTYTDDDNDEPATLKLKVNETGGGGLQTKTMQEESAADTDYMDGKDYYYELTLGEGDYEYWFEADDGDGGEDETTKTTEPTVVS